MDIKTKYNIKDKVFFVKNGAILNGEIDQKVPVGFLRHEPTQVNISVYKKIGWFKRLMIDWCFGLKYYEYGK